MSAPKNYYTSDINPHPNPTASGAGDDDSSVFALGKSFANLVGVGMATLMGSAHARNSMDRRGNGRAGVIVYTLFAVVAGYSLSFILPDLNYQLRMLYISHFTKPLELANLEPDSNGSSSSDKSKSNDLPALPTVSRSAVVFPTDIDHNGHMNNARYFRELNFARRHCFYSLGLWQFARANRINFIVRAQAIRHRKDLKVWEKYTVMHKVAGWSKKEKCFYIEAHFKNEDDFVCAVQFCKYIIVMINGSSSRAAISKEGGASPTPSKNWTPCEILVACGLLPSSRVGKLEENVPPSFVAWEESNRVSSKELRPETPTSNA
jgi:acyl-CoA thioesterase FadM